MKLVLVEWEDSRQGVSAWTTFGELKEADTCLIRSVGWLLRRTKRLLHLVPHIGGRPDQGCGDIIIPRSAVRRITALKKGKRRASRPHR